jgi:hypothetical protein
MQPNHPPAQPDLPLDYSPPLEPVMRELWETRWRRWHPAASFEEAVADPFTRRLLCLTAEHLPSLRPTPRRRRARPKP